MSRPLIVIVDRDEFNVFIIKELVGDLDFCDIVHVNTTQELKSLLNKRKPDLLVCNASMRGTDVRQLCETEPLHVPCVFLSVLKRNEERRHCYLKPQHQYITTPIIPENIENAILSVLQREEKYPV